MKSKIADFIDTVLLFICLSVLGIISARYFTKSVSVIFLSGFTCALVLTFFIGMFKRRKELPKLKQKIIDDALTQFIFSTQEFCFKYMLDSLSKKYDVTSDNNVIFINNTAVVVHLIASPLSLKTLAENYANLTGKVKKLIFLTAYGAEPKASAIAAQLPNIKVSIFDFNKVYSLLNSLDCLPKNEIVMLKKKTNLKLIAREAFSVNKAKKYLIAALLLLASSIFMPYSVYYIVVASILITAAILCRINILKLASHGK